MWELGRGLLRWTIHHKKVGIHVRGTVNPTNSAYFLQHYNLIHRQWWWLSSHFHKYHPEFGTELLTARLWHTVYFSAKGLIKWQRNAAEQSQLSSNMWPLIRLSVSFMNRDLWSSLEQQLCQPHLAALTPNSNMTDLILHYSIWPPFWGGGGGRNYANAASWKKCT